MKIVRDEQLCKGHAVCMGEAPEVFHVTRKGELTLLLPRPGEERRAEVEAAVKYCPTGALSIEPGE